MKIALAQINTTVAAIPANVARIKEYVQRAAAMGAELVCFPELTLTGYPPKDMLALPDFVEANLKAIDELARWSTKPALLVGFVDRSSEQQGKGLANAVALLANGRMQAKYHKWLLPTYDVFDEGRYFDPGKALQPMLLGEQRLGVTICEDMWNDATFWEKHRLYRYDPVEDMVRQGSDLLINLSASPFCIGKRAVKEKMLSAVSKRHGRTLIYVNSVGGNDSLIFDGGSMVFSPEGERLAALKDFEEDLLIYDTAQTTPGEMRLQFNDDVAQAHAALCLGIRDYVRKCRFQRVVIGLSGGIDSALTAALAVEALGRENVVGVSMPSPYSSQHSKDDALQLAQNLGIEYRVVPVTPMFQSYLDNLAPQWPGTEPNITEENLQARIRGMILMALSNKFGWLVLATGNKSEIGTGYCTLYGDMCGGLAPLGDVPKTLVYAISEYINRNREIIPRNTIEKPPSAELRPDQKDTDSLPEYDILDKILKAAIEEHKSPAEIMALGIEEHTVRRVLRLLTHSEYKRQQAPINLKITSQAFGYGWRFPVARGEY